MEKKTRSIEKIIIAFGSLDLFHFVIFVVVVENVIWLIRKRNKES